MNLDGFTPSPVTRFSSLVEQDDPTGIPIGVAPVCRNSKFHLTSVRTRDGIQSQWGFVLPDGGAVAGLASLKLGGATVRYVPIAFSGIGHVYVEAPVGSGNTTPVTSAQVSPPAGASMQVASAYAKGYLAFTSLKAAAGPPAVYDIASGVLDPLSGKSYGQSWAKNTVYQVGEVVTPASPVGGNGHTYRCSAITTGISAAVQPVFPVTEAGVIVDGGVTWTETTPLMAQAIPVPVQPVVTRNAGAGTFAAGRDVYIIVSLVNGNGETSTSIVFIFVNTTLNDQFTVTSPTLAGWIQVLGAPYAVTGYNVYEADVATTTAAPLISAYKKVNVGAVAIGTPTNVNTTGVGAAPPVANSATVVPVGNICAGLRYGGVLFVNRNGYISGMAQAAVFTYTSPSDGLQVYVPHIPIGPANTAARIVAFTPAGQLSQAAGSGITSAGPYFWIPPTVTAEVFDTKLHLSVIPSGVTVADVVNGVSMTSTFINDNITTSATFNFTDNYLKLTLLDVSPYFEKIQVPNCSDIYYSSTLKRMFYATDSLPSGWFVSEIDDPETIYGTTGLMQVAENNGELRTAIRDFKGVVYAMKEKSAYTIDPNTSTDPNSPPTPANWKTDKAWEGSGPCGPRAVDVSTNFMAYVHRSGLYIFSGGEPNRVSIEIPVTWSRINWAYQHLISVCIDDETREIRICVPLDQSTVPSHTLKLNYEESPSFVRPIHFSPFIGKEIASGECYKWSVDDIPANLYVRAERPLVNPPQGIDNATQQSQLLVASSNADGAVSAIIPFLFNDNGVGIDWVVETACPGELMSPNKLGGVQANVDGNGQIQVEVLALRANDPRDGKGSPTTQGAVIPLKRKLTAGIPFSCGARGQNERFRLRFSNGKVPNVWGDLKWCAIYAQKISTSRPGQ